MALLGGGSGVGGPSEEVGMVVFSPAGVVAVVSHHGTAPPWPSIAMTARRSSASMRITYVLASRLSSPLIMEGRRARSPVARAMGTDGSMLGTSGCPTPEVSWTVTVKNSASCGKG